jgi:predicted HicB family RNase H-like nuclease
VSYQKDEGLNIGKFVVRIPPEVHRALAIKAAEDGISLNRLVSTKLTSP